MTDELDGYDEETPGWGHIAGDEAEQMRKYHLANPDDAAGFAATPIERTTSLRGPDFTGAPGYVAIVQGQVFLVATLLITQLFLITVALFELLSGKRDILWWLAGASLLAFLLALLITLWPRKRVVRG
jgi:hypothetical protein